MARDTAPGFGGGAFLSGMAMPFRGAAFLFRHRGLKRYAALPLLVNAILYVIALMLVFWLLYRWRIAVVEWSFWAPLGGWLAAAVNWLGRFAKVVVGIMVFTAAFFTFTAVGMVLASPFNDLLSEKVEAAYAGSARDAAGIPWRITAAALLASVADSCVTLCRQILYALLALPFLFIPVIGFIPLFLVGSYFSGFGFIDSAMSRNHLYGRYKNLMTAGNALRIIGFGAAMQVLFLIPFAGLLLLPVGVTAGTLMYCDTDWGALFAAADMAPPPGFVPPVGKGGDTDGNRRPA